MPGPCEVSPAQVCIHACEYGQALREVPALLPGIASIARSSSAEQLALREELALELMLLMEEQTPRRKCFFTSLCEAAGKIVSVRQGIRSWSKRPSKYYVAAAPINLGPRRWIQSPRRARRPTRSSVSHRSVFSVFGASAAKACPAEPAAVPAATVAPADQAAGAGAASAAPVLQRAVAYDPTTVPFQNSALSCFFYVFE